MTPDQFTQNTSAWIGAGVLLATKLSGLVGAIAGLVALSKARLNELRINGHSRTLETVLRDMPAPGSGGGVNVNAAAPSDVNITTQDTTVTKDTIGGKP